MILVTAFRNAFKNYVNFQGRAGRGEYWWFVLSTVLLYVLIGALAKVSGIFAIIGVLFYLAIILPGLALAARRLHDTDRSAAWILISLLPLIGSIWLLVLLVQKGTTAPNRYGMAPQELTR